MDDSDLLNYCTIFLRTHKANSNILSHTTMTPYSLYLSKYKIRDKIKYIHLHKQRLELRFAYNSRYILKHKHKYIYNVLIQFHKTI